jgi:hypothetical protein
MDFWWGGLAYGDSTCNELLLAKITKRRKLKLPAELEPGTQRIDAGVIAVGRSLAGPP